MISSPRISTRGYYDLSNGRTLKTNSYYLYPAKYFSKLNKDEIVIMVHGLRNNKSGAVSKFRIAQRRLRLLGYRSPVIGFTYDSNTKGAHLPKTEFKALRIGKKIAQKNGKNLAQFIMDFKKTHPKTKIRLMGHSLGTQVIQSAIKWIALRNKKNEIESVHFFGASISNDAMSVQKEGKYFQKVVKEKITNYYSPDDEVLKETKNHKSLKVALGLSGAKGKTISKFRQKKVCPKNHRFASYAAVLQKFP